eukprot:TRINITY_DN114214_c0_g1_i1.p1 TRINITY_DN114214_c0_g1~~TRINITY_DN114214_c0_g1_i1.p1  ORF type:complete len:200 (+),score=15.03 TRINITY_DN114214_c0_g1_i1:76-675(+)
MTRANPYRSTRHSPQRLKPTRLLVGAVVAIAIYAYDASSFVTCRIRADKTWHSERGRILSGKAQPQDSTDVSWAWAALGLPKGASKKDIRQRYRELAGRDHPDRRPGDGDAKQRFEAVSAAYNALVDPPPPAPEPKKRKVSRKLYEEEDPEVDEDILAFILVLFFTAVGVAGMSVVTTGLTWDRCYKHWEWWCSLSPQS